MCSVDDDGLLDMTRATQALEISRGDEKCRRCREAVAVLLLRGKDAYCRDCFLNYFTHKFRSALGKSKQFQPGDRVLVGVSGGPSSTALLHLIHQGLSGDSHKKLRIAPTFLLIDDSVAREASASALSAEVGGGRAEEHEERISGFLHDVVSGVAALGFPCYLGSVEQVMAPQLLTPVLASQNIKEARTQLTTDNTLRTQCRQLFASCKSASARQDLRDHLLLSAVRRCARCLGFTKVLLGDNATTLAVRILSHVALGRGSQLPQRVHFKALCEGVEVYRPMREILQDEVLHYLHLHNIAMPSSPEDLTTTTSNITTCTQDFVLGLQKEFPSTIPTIFRTGDKLVAAETEGDGDRDKHTNRNCTTSNNDRHHTRSPSSAFSSSCSSYTSREKQDTNLDCNIQTEKDISYFHSSSPTNSTSPTSPSSCVLCACRLDTDKGEASALHATLVSQKYSTRIKAGQGKPVDRAVKPEMSRRESENTNSSTSSVNMGSGGDGRGVYDDPSGGGDNNCDDGDNSGGGGCDNDNAACGDNNSGGGNRTIQVSDSNGPSSSGDGGGDGCCGRGGSGGCITKIATIKPQQYQGVEGTEILHHYLCYGCRITVRDLECAELLPSWVHTEAARQEQRRAMREQIKDFLL